jgi:hypothetical protein
MERPFQFAAEMCVYAEKCAVIVKRTNVQQNYILYVQLLSDDEETSNISAFVISASV